MPELKNVFVFCFCVFIEINRCLLGFKFKGYLYLEDEDTWMLELKSSQKILSFCLKKKKKKDYSFT